MITPRDTIAANDSVLDAFRQSGGYDYVRDLGTGDGNDVNYFDVLTQKAGEMFDVDMSWLVLPEWFWWILGGVALAAVGCTALLRNYARRLERARYRWFFVAQIALCAIGLLLCVAAMVGSTNTSFLYAQF